MIEVCDNLHRLRMYRKKVLNISIGNFHRNQIAYNLQALPLSESHSISHHIIWSISDIGPCSVLSDYPTSTDISMFLNPFLYFIHRSLWKARVNLNGFLFRKSISDRWYKHSKHSRIFRTVETFLRLAKWFLVRYQANLSLEPWPNRHGTRLTKPFVVGSTGKKSPSIIAPHSIPLLGSFIP